MKAKSLAAGVLLVASFVASSCYSFVIRSGNPSGESPVEYDEKWHHGLFNGILELDGRYNLDKVCPEGWAEVRTETSAANVAVEILQRIFVGFPIYSPQTVTIVCASRDEAYHLQLDAEGRVVGGQSAVWGAGISPATLP